MCVCVCASERGERVIIISSVPLSAHMHMPPVFTVIGALMMCSRWHDSSGMARWANAKGNTSHRDVPVHEVCKSGNRGGGGGMGTEIRREWNSQARARPPHLGGEGLEG